MCHCAVDHLVGVTRYWLVVSVIKYNIMMEGLVNVSHYTAIAAVGSGGVKTIGRFDCHDSHVAHFTHYVSVIATQCSGVVHDVVFVEMQIISRGVTGA